MNVNYIAAIGLGLIAGACFLVWCIVQIWARVENPKVKNHLTDLLYMVDEQCDNMEIPAKRAMAIMAVQQLLGWRRVFLPSVVVGFVLDLMVKIVRKIGVPDLHQAGSGDSEAQP